MVRVRKPPSQTWRTFLENHFQTMVSVDFFTVPSIRFQVLYVFLVLAHDRRRILHFAATAHPTAEWTAATAGGVSVGQRTAFFYCETATAGSVAKIVVQTIGMFYGFDGRPYL